MPLRCRQGIRRALGAVVMTTLLGACTLGPGSTGPQAMPGQSLNWADVMEDANLADSIYAIGLQGFGSDFCTEDCPTAFFLTGTGFVAHYPNTIWTNAHVALALREAFAMALAENPPHPPVPVAVRAGTAIGGAHTHLLNVDTIQVHPEYEQEPVDGDDTPDLAAFQVDGLSIREVPSFLPRRFATELRVGQPVGSLGFPGVLTNPFEAVPIATFKEGTISALRPYRPEETEVTQENSKVVQFNLGLTGGTSGSPVFDHEGFIVAVSFSGTGVSVVDTEGFPAVVPLGDLDFGIRVDEVWTLIDLIEAAAQPPPAAGSRGYPFPTYRAYPYD